MNSLTITLVVIAVVQSLIIYRLIYINRLRVKVDSLKTDIIEKYENAFKVKEKDVEDLIDIINKYRNLLDDGTESISAYRRITYRSAKLIMALYHYNPDAFIDMEISEEIVKGLKDYIVDYENMCIAEGIDDIVTFKGGQDNNQNDASENPLIDYLVGDNLKDSKPKSNIDSILDKISKTGVSSLTPEELKILKGE